MSNYSREEGRERESDRERKGESFVYMFVPHIVCTVYTCT